MYKKQLKTSIILNVIEIITFFAIIAIYHFDVKKALYPLLWFLLTVFVLECGLSVVFKNEEKRWGKRWKTPLWQIALWIVFVIGGFVAIFKYPKFWDSYNFFYFFIFFAIGSLCRNITRYMIVKRYDFDKYSSTDELLSEHPEARIYIE